MQLGSYQVLGEISRGSMGVIYKAHDRALDRTVAIKVMSTGGGEFAHEDQARFRREALSMARIRHPNVVAIHGAGMANGAPYIVLDFVEGESLADRLRRGPLKPRHAAKLARDLAAALEVAHAEGVLHRDLKPANVLIDRKGKVLLTDFGLAKNMYDGDPLTLSEMVLGTPAYMSPEQAMGSVDRIGPQSDVYGLGAILYALLTGRPPIKGTVVTEVLERVIHEAPPPPTSITQELDPPLEAIVLRCLEKDPADRFETVRQLKDALQRYLTPPGKGGASSGALAASTVLGSVLGFALGVGVTLAFWSDRTPSTEPTRPPTATEPPPEHDAPPPTDSPPTQPPPVEPPPPTRPPTPERPEPTGPKPAPPELRDQNLAELQHAVASMALDLPAQARVMFPFNTPTKDTEAQRLLKDLDRALKDLDEPKVRKIVGDLLERKKEAWAQRLALYGLAHLGEVFQCAETLNALKSLNGTVPGFKGKDALAKVLQEDPGKSVTDDHFAVLGGYWEFEDDHIRSGGKPFGPHETTTLLQRDSQRPTGQYRLNLWLDLRHLESGDAAGLVFAGEASTTYWALYLRRENAGEVAVRLGSVTKGIPNMEPLGRLPFSPEVDLQLDVTASEIQVQVADKHYTHTLKEPVPQGYRGLFRRGKSIVVYSRLGHEPR